LIEVRLAVLSAGAAKGVVTALQAPFATATGAQVQGTFGAVGAIKEKLQAGEACDVIILTAPMIDDLERDGRVVAATRAPLGRVRTGIAIRSGSALPAIGEREALRRTLLSSAGVYIPDPQRATAGIHFVKVLHNLGIHGELEPRLRVLPNGAAAMQALASAHQVGVIGCTQITEIISTQGVTLVGALAAEFELATVYVAAVSRQARRPDLARSFAEFLCGPESQPLRVRAGFE
jgi:molybdate transport system substrate-binding protein